MLIEILIIKCTESLICLFNDLKFIYFLTTRLWYKIKHYAELLTFL